jgi:hypothetical protein
VLTTQKFQKKKGELAMLGYTTYIATINVPIGANENYVAPSDSEIQSDVEAGLATDPNCAGSTVTVRKEN